MVNSNTFFLQKVLLKLRDKIKDQMRLLLQCTKKPFQNKPPDTLQSTTEMTKLVESTRVTVKSKGLSEVAGLRDIKVLLRSLCILPQLQPQLYTEKTTCNTFLLFGPPGTGKTMLVHALAAEAKYNLYSASSSDILSSYVGTSEK